MHPGAACTELGGAEADLDVETSVARMIDVIDRRRGEKGTAQLDHNGARLV